MLILGELKRRNVFRVAAAYLASAWLLIEVAGTLFPLFGYGDGPARVLVMVLAVGFIPALVLAWAFELTPDGLRRDAEVTRSPADDAGTGKRLDRMIMVVLAAALAVFAFDKFVLDPARDEAALEAARDEGAERVREHSQATAAAIPSIAVLPFEDMSEAGDQEYFADGMAEELLNLLAREPGLRVAGRTSSFSFKNSDKQIVDIAGELGVTHVLEGSVRTSGASLRVAAQLVQAVDGFQLWSKTFDRELSDVFAVQDEIAAAVVEDLRVRLVPATADRPSARVTNDMAAYDEYLLGRYELARRTPESLVTALGHFEAAVDADPDFSPAWSGLAKTLVVSPYYRPLAPWGELAERTQAAALRALKLDPENSEAHSVLGTAKLMFTEDLQGAEIALRRSVELRPNDAGNVNLYGDFLYTNGNFTGALEQEALAASLEPLSATNQHELALVLGLLGRLEEAIEKERLAVRLNPQQANAWASLARFLVASGALTEARAIATERRHVLGEVSALLLEARIALADGDPQAARELGLESLTLAGRQEGSLLQIASLFAALGDDARAAELLELAIAEGDPLLRSPLFFFLPEEWSELPAVHRALESSGLEALFEQRRRNLAAGRGPVRSATAVGDQASQIENPHRD